MASPSCIDLKKLQVVLNTVVWTELAFNLQSLKKHFLIIWIINSPSTPFSAFALSGDGSTRGGKFKADIRTGKVVGQAWSEAASVVKKGFQNSIPMSMRIIEEIVRNFIFRARVV